MLDIDKLTLGQLKEISKISCAVPEVSHPYTIGEKYLIRTVTHYYTGRLISIHKNELVMEDAAWIPDTGRYYNCLSTGKFEEVEPINVNLIISRGAIIDCVI